MTTHRFETLARSLSSRLSRRTALQASGLGFAAGLVAASPHRVTAQDAAATPDPLADDATFVFVQSAASGTFTVNPGAGTSSTDGTPIPGGGADYLLTLEGHTGDTVYFSDRPERIFGEAPTQAFLDGLGFSPSNPPNAAIVTQTDDGTEDVLVVELLNPSYDAAVGTVSYGANILSDYDGAGLAYVAARQQDESLPQTLSNVSLFIDDCPDLTGCAFDDPEVGAFEYFGALPGGPIGQCWHWKSFSCIPCNGNSTSSYDALCNQTYSGCGGACQAG
jgi:hypothetical protein